jgi:hypothetical protein
MTQRRYGHLVALLLALSGSACSSGATPLSPAQATQQAMLAVSAASVLSAATQVEISRLPPGSPQIANLTALQTGLTAAANAYAQTVASGGTPDTAGLQAAMAALQSALKNLATGAPNGTAATSS